MKDPYITIRKNDKPCLSEGGVLINYFVGVVIDPKNFLMSYAATLDEAFKKVQDYLNKVA